jgi:copper chaperone NosL
MKNNYVPASGERKGGASNFEFQAASRIIRIVALALVTVAAAGLMACGPRAGEPQPPEIHYGQEMCDECGMLIGEPRFAAATVDADGRAYKFDDIGNMLLFHDKHPEIEVRAWFVHDYDSEAWVRAETAFFVQSELIDTPMGHGIAALADKAAADALAGRIHGEVLTLEQLRSGESIAAHEEH